MKTQTIIVRQYYLRFVVDGLYCKIVGDNKTSFYNGEDYIPYTIESLADDITNEILSADKPMRLFGYDKWVEPKLFKFMTAEKIKEIVTMRCRDWHDHDKWAWELQKPRLRGNTSAQEKLYELCDKTNTSRDGIDHLIKYYTENLGWTAERAIDYAIGLFQNGTIECIKKL